MHRQVGDLVIDDDGIARRGLLVRHLVMPGSTDEGEAILSWLAREVSEKTYVNVMDQYRPDHKADRYSEIGRRPWPKEVSALRAHARELGLRLDERRRISSLSFRH